DDDDDEDNNNNQNNIDALGRHYANVAFGTLPLYPTHIVTNTMQRTAKLMEAFSTVVHFVTEKWITDSISAGEWLPEEDFPVDDEETKKQQKDKKFNLYDSLGSNRHHRDETNPYTLSIKVNAPLIAQYMHDAEKLYKEYLE